MSQQNQKERAIALLAANGYLMTQFLTNEQFPKYWSGFLKNGMLGVSIPDNIAHAGNVGLAVLYVIAASWAAFLSFRALKLAGGSQAEIDRAERLIGRSLLLFTGILGMVLLALAAKVRAA